MASLLIKGGRVISPEDKLDGVFDILIEDSLVREIAPNITTQEPDESLDARGQVVSPGLVDLHTHLREPGGEDSETLETGLSAAAAGGFTAVCAMPNTHPVNDRTTITRDLVDKAKQLGLARLFPVAAVSTRSIGESLTDYAALVTAGAVGFSDDGLPVRTAGLMRLALEKARWLGVPIIDHCEDRSLSAGGVVNDGAISGRLNLRGIPNTAEDVCVARDLVLADETGAHVHLAHLSTRRALEMVRVAKRRGVRVTCEVTPHHFTLSDEAVVQCGANAKMNPPLRSAQDVEAVIAAIVDGTVDAIATDHAPHAPALKQKPIAEAPFGIIGLETALALGLSQLVHPGRISLWHLISLLSVNPARIINQPVGRLRAENPADIVVFDPNREWTYSAALGRSKSRNTPFDGWKFKGAVTATIIGGKIAYRRN